MDLGGVDGALQLVLQGRDLILGGDPLLLVLGAEHLLHVLAAPRDLALQLLHLDAQGGGIGLLGLGDLRDGVQLGPLRLLLLLAQAFVHILSQLRAFLLRGLLQRLEGGLALLLDPLELFLQLGLLRPPFLAEPLQLLTVTLGGLVQLGLQLADPGHEARGEVLDPILHLLADPGDLLVLGLSGGLLGPLDLVLRLRPGTLDGCLGLLELIAHGAGLGLQGVLEDRTLGVGLAGLLLPGPVELLLVLPLEIQELLVGLLAGLAQPEGQPLGVAGHLLQLRRAAVQHRLEVIDPRLELVPVGRELGDGLIAVGDALLHPLSVVLVGGGAAAQALEVGLELLDLRVPGLDQPVALGDGLVPFGEGRDVGRQGLGLGLVLLQQLLVRGLVVFRRAPQALELLVLGGQPNVLLGDLRVALLQLLVALLDLAVAALDLLGELRHLALEGRGDGPQVLHLVHELVLLGLPEGEQAGDGPSLVVLELENRDLELDRPPVAVDQLGLLGEDALLVQASLHLQQERGLGLVGEKIVEPHALARVEGVADEAGHGAGEGDDLTAHVGDHDPVTQALEHSGLEPSPLVDPLVLGDIHAHRHVAQGRPAGLDAGRAPADVADSAFPGVDQGHLVPDVAILLPAVVDDAHHRPVVRVGVQGGQHRLAVRTVAHVEAGDIAHLAIDLDRPSVQVDQVDEQGRLVEDRLGHGVAVQTDSTPSVRRQIGLGDPELLPEAGVLHLEVPDTRVPRSTVLVHVLPRWPRGRRAGRQGRPFAFLDRCWPGPFPASPRSRAPGARAPGRGVAVS